MIRGCFVPMLLLLLSFAVAAAAPEYKVEKTGACAGADVSDAMKGVLQPEGLRLSAESGPICDVWLRKAVPMKSGSSTPDYSNINTGDFVGIIVYLKDMSDYRGQAVKAGTYTMRYQTMPTDGNHMGVSPTTDYVLLAPAGVDKDPAAPIEYQTLLDLSRKASATNHPAPLYLVAPGAGGSPSFRDTGDGRWALEAKTKAQPAGGAEFDFPLALVLIGKGEE